MFGTVRRFGPVVLIPAAWIAAGAATVGVLNPAGMLIAHLVMVAFISFFLATGWRRMADGALRAWRAVLVVGLGLTLVGVAGFVGPVSGPALLGVSLVGWMVLPALGLAHTARELPEAALVYAGGTAAALLGAGVFVWTLLSAPDPLVWPSFGLVAIGHTAGIVDAARR
ncbi:hypothetical protein [Halobellus ruber]|uniref:Uncharacterized protein n=1 Tax=Halobellus ruber TaxID=2761102 RepID=A0A7J9SI01_9EURY|nr:hypothetical protein [Halobellus ruber]MBB6645636.1 hypothetical protein [Halobellus ruber]